MFTKIDKIILIVLTLTLVAIFLLVFVFYKYIFSSNLNVKNLINGAQTEVKNNK